MVGLRIPESREHQADNGAGLNEGNHRMVNNGQPRKPDDWGSLRRGPWGARAHWTFRDYPTGMAAVGIDGVSPICKAALVTMAMDTRFAVVLVGSSGEGGAKLHRAIGVTR